MEFVTKNNIRVLTISDADYPQRLCECPDAPLLLYYKGSADLNQGHVINIVGTRHCTTYGQDIVRRLITDLRTLCPQVLIVSGLAYGIDICAHRNALEQGFATGAVLAHGLDQIYPPHHRKDAVRMLSQGGLLTEYMSQTEALPNNFRQRNRIVAGMSDATILVESAIKGGGLITCRIAQEYGRDVFAFPGAVGMSFSEGCNKMIRNNTAALITSAEDLLESLGWQTMQQKPEAVERQLFPDLTPEEQQVVGLLQQTNDHQRQEQYPHRTTYGPALLAGDEGNRKTPGRRNVPFGELRGKRNENWKHRIRRTSRFPCSYGRRDGYWVPHAVQALRCRNGLYGICQC